MHGVFHAAHVDLITPQLAMNLAGADCAHLSVEGSECQFFSPDHMF